MLCSMQYAADDHFLFPGVLSSGSRAPCISVEIVDGHKPTTSAYEDKTAWLGSDASVCGIFSRRTRIREHLTSNFKFERLTEKKEKEK